MKEKNALAITARTIEMLIGFDDGNAAKKTPNPDGVPRKMATYAVLVDRKTAARQIQATLDIAYLLGNLDGWFTEKQDHCFEIIVAGPGRKTADVSPRRCRTQCQTCSSARQSFRGRTVESLPCRRQIR